MNDFTDKVAVVTGAGSGIGLETARLLAQRGARVVMSDISAERIDDAAAELTAQHHRVLPFAGDVSHFSDMQRLAAFTASSVGPADILFLNAGIGGTASFFDDDTTSWETIVGVNLLGVVWGIKAFLPQMTASDQESVILATSSAAGAEGTSYNAAAYAATKTAVVSIMEGLYGQLRDRHSPLHVGIVFPPLTATRLYGDGMNMSIIEDQLQTSGVPATLVTPDQVAAMIIDGIERERFFIRAGAAESSQFFNHAITRASLDWTARVVHGRARAQLHDSTPDAYLW